jgi:hypothetical protein
LGVGVGEKNERVLTALKSVDVAFKLLPKVVNRGGVGVAYVRSVGNDEEQAERGGEEAGDDAAGVRVEQAEVVLGDGGVGVGLEPDGTVNP